MSVDIEQQTGKLATIDEACRVLGLGRSSIYKLIEGKRLRSVKIGSSRRIWTRDLEKFMANLLGAEDDD